MTYDIYSYAIIIYLLGILSLGLYFSKGVKTVSSFTIADKRFGTFILLMTFIATSLGAGSTVGDTAKIARDGIVFPLSMIGFFVFCYYMSKYVAKKFDSRFEGMVSSGDIIEHFYGVTAAKIASLFGFFAGSLTVGAQITGLGYLLENTVGIPYNSIVPAIGAVITIYSALGGIKSVTATDTLQAIIILVVIPAFCITIINHAGGIGSVLNSAPPQLFEVFNMQNFRKYFAYFIVSFMPFLWLYPPVIQRFLMAKKPAQIAKMYHFEFITRIIFFTLLTMVAVSSFVLLPGTSSDTIISALIHNFMPQYLGVFLVIAILSASMSTADSHLHSSAVLLVHNVINSGVKSGVASKNSGEIKLMQLSTLVLGAVATGVAIQKLEIVSLVILSFSFSGAVIGIPLFFGVLGLKVSKYKFYGCLISAIIALVICLFILGLSLINVASIIVLAGLVGFFASKG